MSIEAPPPSLPPQMSPDGKWIWDGAQWRPIPVHEAAFPNWKGVGAGFIPEADARPAVVALVPPPATRRQAAPPPAFRMAGPAPDIAVPLWRQQPPARIKNAANITAGAVVLVVVAILFVVFVPPIISARQDAATPRAAAATSPGPTTRSQSAEAAYLLKALDGPMGDLTYNTNLVRQVCAAGLTGGCNDQLIFVQRNLAVVVPIVDSATIPACLATLKASLSADIAGLSAGDDLALKGFKDNRKSELVTGASNVAVLYGPRVQADFARMKAAAPRCDGDVTGP